MRPTSGTGRDHYFSANPRVGSAPRAVDVHLPDMSLSLVSDSGVFSSDRLDPGTKLLLVRAGSPAPSGDLLDLGCGSGAVALTMARRAPEATVWAIDINDRALDLCRRNASANHVGNVRVVAPHDVPSEVRFATIWSNPPIRVGKPALHDLLLQWFRRLLPAATATMVVHKNLGSDSLQRWLGANGFPTERLASAQGYRILRTSAR